MCFVMYPKGGVKTTTIRMDDSRFHCGSLATAVPLQRILQRMFRYTP